MGYLCSRCGGVSGLFESSHLHSNVDACLSELKAEKQRLNLQVEELQKKLKKGSQQIDGLLFAAEESNRLIDEIKKTALPFLEMMRQGWDRDHYLKMLGPLENILGLAEKRKDTPPIEDPQPVGVCPNCKTPVYTVEGYCGVCFPQRAAY